jgi:hypothetical protein
LATDHPSKSKLRFKIIDLFRITAFLSVIAWLLAAGFLWVVPIWCGAVLGFEIGRKSSYPMLLVCVCGAVGGLAFSMALFSTLQMTKANGLVPFGAGVVWWPAVVSWLTFVLIFWWVLFRVRGS